jgi:adenylate cyclase class IV
MENNIEVELRGRLTTDEYNELHTFLLREGKYKERKNRILLDYSTFMPEEGIANRTRDIRLRVTNGQPEIITKLGRWGGGENRKEISVLTEKGSFDRLVETYAVLGYTKAILCIRNTEVFEYKDIEFALVEVPGHSYYFEAETMVSSLDSLPDAHEKIGAVCKDLKLNIFDDEGFYKYIEVLNKEANEVFEYNTVEEGYFENRFSLSLNL